MPAVPLRLQARRAGAAGATAALLLAVAAIVPVAGAPRVAVPPPPAAPLGPPPVLDGPPDAVHAAVVEGAAYLAAQARDQEPTDPFERIDACVEADMARTDTPGASIAIAVDGQIVHARGFGVKHEGVDEPVDEDTLFRIGSTTKMLTAAAVMQQVEAGRLDLDAPLPAAIPGWDVAGAWDWPGVTGADVTLRHLMSHTSAYPDRAFIDTGLDWPDRPDALAAWARTGLSVTLHAPPGAFWNYSNPGFMLAGLAVQNAAGMAYADYMRQMVWAKAGMDATFLDPDEVLAYGNFTHGHRWIDPATGAETVFAPDDYDNAAVAPAGYAFSRPKDLVRWADLLMRGGGDVLAPASVAEMTSAQSALGIRPGQDYGLGIFRTEELGRVIYDHGGNIPGWSSQLYWSPSDRVAVSVLANTIASLTRAAGCAMVTMLAADAPPAVDETTDPATWSRYLGAYRGLLVTGDPLELVVTRGLSDTLTATFPGLEIAPGVDYTSTMRQAAYDTFVLDGDGDGSLETPVTFIDHPDRPGEPFWLRARQFVLTRQAAVAPTPAPTAEPTPAAAGPVYLPVAHGRTADG